MDLAGISKARVRVSLSKPFWWVLGGAVVLALMSLASLMVGPVSVDVSQAWSALFSFDPNDTSQVVVRKLRLPRTFLAIVSGCCLAVAGAITQGVTRNPLGGPGILGINAGAAFAMVTAIHALNILTPSGYVWFAFIGAVIAGFLVYLVAQVGPGGATPVKLALAGAVVTALLSAWTSTLLLLDEETLDEARFWLAGSLTGRGTEEVRLLLPLIIVALVGSLLLGASLNTLSLGEETAVSLGQRVGLVRLSAGVISVVLAASAVAIAGPIAFVGLAVPHIARALVGSDYRWVTAMCLTSGPCLLLGADIVGRMVVSPLELQVGIVTALVGAPFLIFLVRSRRLTGL
ncbi:MAG TPA: iron ABC transporter permease [Acidimicrobiaceae bacterium]|nr:iron ABC transporter permease [Acidimicrobiaceae bacterium]